MNKIYTTLCLLLFGLTLIGQSEQSDIESSRYVFYELSEGQFSDALSSIDLKGLKKVEELTIQQVKSKLLKVPFYGNVKLNSNYEITHLKAIDPISVYSIKTVRLKKPIGLTQPSAGGVSTGYQLLFGPDELNAHFLNQLPIRPDSIRVLVDFNFSDTPGSEVKINRNSETIETTSFHRTVTMERKVEVKIEPFGWESVNDIAPMIDWDQAYSYDQVIFSNAKMHLPVGIIENRDGVRYLAVLENQSNNQKKVIGVPTIQAVPNPVINDLRFEINNVPSGNYTIRIKNILGEQKLTKTVSIENADIIPIDIDALRKGSYFYILEDSEGNILSTKRLIVLRP